MIKSTFSIQQMDCPAEEQLVRMKLEGMADLSALQFDLEQRRLDVYHAGDPQPILARIDELQLGASLLESRAAEDPPHAAGDESLERTLLKQVLAINFLFFLLEVGIGFLVRSMGLAADGLDMLADSLVYGLALFAIGGGAAGKKRVARASGYLQMTLAVFGLVEVLRRFAGNEMPLFQWMIGISCLALIGNAASLILLQRSRNREAHMQASLIFTSNDVIANLGVILAGILVHLTGSKLPDLVTGAAVFLLVGRGAWRILRLSK